MITNLYDSCVRFARHKFSKYLLAFIAFIESSIFPIPPDVMVVPMVIGKKEEEDQPKELKTMLWLIIFIIKTQTLKY